MRSRIGSAHILALIAIILALGGNALAFTLGKNSVGPKQLKKNSVTTAKIKNEAVTAAKVKKGTLTGAQINSSTLGEVPAATKAGDAATLEGSPSSDFAKSSRFLFGHAKYNATTSETLFTVPGDFLLKTNGLGKYEPNLVIEGVSADPWDFLTKEGKGVWEGESIKAGESSEFNIGVAEAGIIYAVDTTHPENQALIDCTFEFNTFEFLCTAVLSPTA